MQCVTDFVTLGFYDIRPSENSMRLYSYNLTTDTRGRGGHSKGKDVPIGLGLMNLRKNHAFPSAVTLSHVLKYRQAYTRALRVSVAYTLQ